MFVPTRASLLKSKDEDSCETFVFETRKKAKSSGKPGSTPGNFKPNKKASENLDMKKLRYEIIKFGSSGFDVAKKEESMKALAVSLGAKPPKGKYRNYKEILAEKKKEKDESGKISKKNAYDSLLKKREVKWKGRKGKETKGLLKNYGKVTRNKK